MSTPRLNREKLKKALLGLNEKEVRTVLGAPTAPDSEHADACLQEFATCGCVVVRHPVISKQKARDAVTDLIREYIAAWPDAVARLDTHLVVAAQIESHYHAILASLDKLPVAKSSPEIRVWACIDCAVRGIAESLQRLTAEMKAHTSNEPFMIKRPSITDESGEPQNVDGIIWGLTRGTGEILQMMGYQNEWFDATTGELVLADRVETDQALSDQAGLVFYLGFSWTDLQRGWQRVRYFDGSVASSRTPLTFDNRPEPVEVDLLEFGPPTKWELYDRIAVSRLEQSMLQDAIKVSRQPDKSAGIKPASERPLALPALGNFISMEERVAFAFLEEVLFLPMQEDADHAGGLSLKEWLRGYAYLALSCPRDSDDNVVADVLMVSRQTLLDGLTSVGFTSARAERFVRLTTFGKTARDLMDDPLVRLANGSYMIFAPGYNSPVLANILTSRLGRLSTDFSDRGYRFEAAVNAEFTKAGLPAHSFKYKFDGTQYDCDVAVIWDRILFVIECKNHGIAFNHLPSLKHFTQEFFHAASQAARTMKHFEDAPELVKQHFGQNAEWDRIVGVVIYATPWAMGRIVKEADIFSYDASALARFFNDGQIGVESPHQHGANVTVLRRHRISMWTGKKPVVADFLRQLETPIQTKMERAGRSVHAQFRETAERRGVACPDWKSDPLTTEQTLESMGLPSEEAKAVVASFREFHEVADRHFESKEEATDSLAQESERE